MLLNCPFSVCLHYYPFSITNEGTILLAKLARHEHWQAESEEGIAPPTRWQLIWQHNHCLAAAIWYFTRRRELYMKCQGIDQWGKPLLGSDNGATHGGSRISPRVSLSTLGGFVGGGMTVNDARDDCEDEWLLAWAAGSAPRLDTTPSHTSSEVSKSRAPPTCFGFCAIRCSILQRHNSNNNKH